MSIRLFTSESVTEGHPDKVCDRISDAVLDEILMKYEGRSDRFLARTAVEALATTGMVLVAGEISCDVYVEIPEIVRNAVKEIGYNSADQGFDGNTCAVLTTIHEQSENISRAVNAGSTRKSPLKGLRAGDQGIMFGYATSETAELMPLPIMIAHRLAERLALVRKSGILDWVRPDGKTQVTVEYDENGRAVGLDAVIISTMHKKGTKDVIIREGLFKEVILPVASAYGFDFSGEACFDCRRGESFKVSFDGSRKPTRIFINPSGSFEMGGPNADTGLTGRKIIVDTYGGMANHGGGCFSGKDATKVDRSGNYAARYVAKNVVKAGLASKCEIELAYAIGVEKPVAVSIDTFGTSNLPEEEIVRRIGDVFDLTPGGIIKKFGLFDVSEKGFNYKRLSSYGHFGRDEAHAPWERTDAADSLR